MGRLAPLTLAQGVSQPPLFTQPDTLLINIESTTSYDSDLSLDRVHGVSCTAYALPESRAAFSADSSHHISIGGSGWGATIFTTGGVHTTDFQGNHPTAATQLSLRSKPQPQY